METENFDIDDFDLMNLASGDTAVFEKSDEDDGFIVIGEIDFSEMINEDTIDHDHPVNFGGQLAECQIIINPKEGDIPHFHIRSNSKLKKYSQDICVRLDKPEYFIHGKHTGTLPGNKECKTLYKWLKGNMKIKKKDDKGNEIIEKVRRWDYMVSLVNNNNENKNPIKISSMPDYSTIFESK